MKQIFLITLTVLGCASTAHAECPEQAVQAMFNVKSNVYAGQEKDIKQVFGWANEAMEKCSDNAPVLAIAAELFQIVGDSIAGNKNKHLAYTQAYKAVIKNGKAYDTIAPTPSVMFADGSKKKLYTYSNATNALEKSISKLAFLHMNGYPSDIFKYSYSANQTCPHISESRVLDEAEALRIWADTDGKKLWPAVHRVNGLHIVCPKYRPGLSYHLTIMNSRQASYYAKSGFFEKAVTHVKRAQKHYNEYRPKAKNFPTYRSYLLPKDLETKLAEYQEKLNQTPQ